VQSETLDFTQPELERYARQIRLDGFGLDGQRRLRDAHVAISRGGGVGGSVAAHLARAGIGRITIAHGGEIVPEFLNRMPLAFPEDLGRPCADAFRDMLARINPDVATDVIPSYVNDDNVEQITKDADLIVDGAPLFEERYALNREAVTSGRPLVSGAMYDTEGYVTTVLPGKTACLACIYPAKPEFWTDISVFPAISPGPGLVASMMAMEAIKVLTGLGEPLHDQLWFFDLRTNVNRTFQVSRRPDCAVCAGHAG
jgi:molybdopterin/thiamine biosynthesis adenylyltransferase